jgi:PAS domain S-box-containing protein
MLYNFEDIATPQIIHFLNSSPFPIMICDDELRVVFVSNLMKKHFKNKDLSNKYIYDILEVDLAFLSKQIELSKHFVTGTDQILRITGAAKFNLPEKWHLFYIKTIKFSGFLFVGESPEINEKFFVENPFELFWDLVIRLENKYRIILDTLPDAVFLHLTNGRIIDVNETALQMYRATKQQLLESTIEEISGHGFTQEKAYQHIQEALKKGTSVFFWVARDLEGKEFPVEVRLTKITFEAKTYIIAVVTNLTQIRSLEKELFKLETRYSNIFKNSPIGIMLINRNLIIEELNPSMENILTIKKNVYQNKSVKELYLPDIFYKKLESTFDQKSSYSFQMKIPDYTHEPKHLQVYLSYQQTQDQKEFCICILEDLSREKKALRKHIESERRYRSLIDHSLSGVLISDKEGNILFANRRVEELSGYSLTELKGKKFYDFVHPEDKNLAIQTFRKRFRSKTRVPVYELRVIDKNQDIHWILVSGAPIRYFNQVAVMDNIIDITDMKKLEKQLIHTQKMESMGRMVAGMTHDFNNILAILKGYISMLKMMVSKDQQIEEHFNVIEKTIGNAENLIKDLLAFAKKKSIQKKEIHLNELLIQFKPILSKTVGRKIKLEYDLEAEEDVILGNQNQIEQVILNLVINAADALQDRENPKISIRTANIKLLEPLDTYIERIPANDYIVLIVKDNGCGIPTKHMEQIFDPFFTTKDVNVGTGMGLAISAGIIKSHGGFMNVNSIVDKGTTFYIYFPQKNK